LPSGGGFDEASLRCLVDATVAVGSDGVAVPGLVEAAKRTDRERQRVVGLTLEVVAGRRSRALRPSPCRSCCRTTRRPTGSRSCRGPGASRGRSPGSAVTPATIVGGLGGRSLPDELRRGSGGAMTGFAVPEVSVAIRIWFRR